MKGYVELTDSLGNRCTLKATSIDKVCERKRYRNYELYVSIIGGTAGLIGLVKS
jgi:hypothetical protein|nr:MAG TPA: hypothetical protein [Caudoviricetes sp.]